MILDIAASVASVFYRDRSPKKPLPSPEIILLATSVKTLAEQIANLARMFAGLYNQVAAHHQAILNLQQFNANLVKAMGDRSEATSLPDIGDKTPDKPN